MAERLADSPSSRKELRQSNRAPSDFQMMVILHKEGKEIGHTVRTTDISQAGARIKLKGILVPGQTIQLLPAEDSRIAYPCRVVWASPPGPERLREAGLEFKTPWTVSRQEFSNTLARI